MIKNRFYRLAWLILLLVLAVPSYLVFGQENGSLITTDQFVYRKWDNTNGLPQNTIFDIVRDQSGYIWGATEEGFVRFDGNEFTLFNKDNTPGLHSNYIKSLSISSGGGIWAAPVI